MMEDFTSSTPIKKASPAIDDSGCSIQLSGDGGGSSEEGEPLRLMKCLDGDATIIRVIEGDDLSVDGDFEADDSSLSLIAILQQSCGKKLKWVVIGVLVLLYTIYFVSALVIAAMRSCDNESHDVTPLIYLTIGALVIILFTFIKSKFGDSIVSRFEPMVQCLHSQWHILKWVCCLVPALGVLVVIIMSAVQSSSNLVSLAGWLFFVGILLIFSKAPRKIKLRPVLGGFALQLLFAVLILKSDVGYKLFYNIGSVLRTFLSYTDAGSKFVLGSLNEHFFAFKILPVIIFFSCIITMLYYLGVMQAIISKLACVMRFALGTTAAESMCAAGNIFVGLTEAPILIRPFLSLMTRSELHAVMVGGFATIAGAVMAAYIMSGIPATHLLTASVMNAPAALAVSKILYPEIGRSRISKMKQIMKDKQQYNNVIEAAAAGASQAICLVANVAANLIAFVALLNFMNAAISWFGAFVCVPELSFQMICNYALRPVAFLMGVEWEDAGFVAELIGVKTFLNEFYAYEKLTEVMKNRKECLDGPVISIRSEVISTYALCGFANLSSIGIQLGGLGPMAPNRLGDLAQIAMSALLGGIITNFMTACVAGLLVVDTSVSVIDCLNSTAIANSTMLVNSTMLFNSTMI